MRKILSKIKWRLIFFWTWRRHPVLVLTFLLRPAPKVKPLPITPENQKAVNHVATMPRDGVAQLEVLIANGLKPHHKVLEIGCGALIAGYPIMQYVGYINYYGIEPEMWAVLESVKVTKQDVRCLDNTTFDGSPFGEKFDFILAHSVMSHGAHWQMDEFLANTSKVLNKGGKVCFSFYFCDGNEMGAIKYNPVKADPEVMKKYKDGIYGGDEYDFKEWVYPRNSFFVRSRFFFNAAISGFKGEEDVYAEMLINNANPHYKHSWVLLEKI